MSNFIQKEDCLKNSETQGCFFDSFKNRCRSRNSYSKQLVYPIFETAFQLGFSVLSFFQFTKYVLHINKAFSNYLERRCAGADRDGDGDEGRVLGAVLCRDGDGDEGRVLGAVLCRDGAEFHESDSTRVREGVVDLVAGAVAAWACRVVPDGVNMVLPDFVS